MGKVGILAHRSGKTAILAEHVAELRKQGHTVVTVSSKIYPEDVVKAIKDDISKQPIDFEITVELTPPRRLSIDINSPDYHPSYVRVGVRVDGKERNDLQWYDVDKLEYMTTAKTSHLAESIEPYWRYVESRQQRRARERWEGKHR